MTQIDSACLHVVAPLPSLNRRTRLAKLMEYLQVKNWVRIAHAGWSREEGDFTDHGLPVHKVCLLSGGGYGSLAARALYLLWGLKVFFYCLRIPARDTVWALGLESAFPATLASRVKGFAVIFDDADRFAMLFKWPRAIRWVIERAELWTSRRCNVHAVPNLSRYDYSSPNHFLLENVPSKGALAAAKLRARQLEVPGSKGIVLNLNGWLGSGRGMSTALEAISRIPQDELTVLLVGKLACKEAEQIAALPNVIVLGEVCYAESLAWFYRSDLIFTYYDPSDPINRKAQSNKWGDAFLTGAGMVVNSEVERSHGLVAIGAAWAAPYHDAESLIAFLRGCVSDRSPTEAMRAASAKRGAELMLFDDYLDQLFGKVGGRGYETSSKD